MSEKKRHIWFTIVVIIASGAVFFALGFTAAKNYDFVKTRIRYKDVPLNTTTAPPFDGRLDLNTATVEQLMQIDGIGEKTAQNIIDYREKIGGYQFVEQLLYVEGIGETKYNRWSPYLTVGGTDGTTVTSTSDIATSTTATSTTAFSGKYDLNTVTIEQLMTINGIGEKIAKSIVDYREDIGGFDSLEQLKDIEGIGDKRFSVLCEYLTVND